MEAKDIYLANEYYDKENGVNIRYQSGDFKGDIITKKFTNTLDYSLELPKINEFYEKRYRNRKFKFEKNGHEYTIRIINVTYNYAVKEWNKEYGNYYIKLGYKYNEMEFVDHVCVKDGILIGIEVDTPIENCIDISLLPEYFTCSEGMYIENKSIPAVVSTKDLREYTYTKGFKCDGIDFVRYKRSSGAARTGKCLFIDKNLYKDISKWEKCGLDIKVGQDIDLAAYEAYISLPLSSIVDTVEIHPDNILLIDDYESIFDDDVIETYNDGNKLKTRERTITIKNSIWDGESLIDPSIMGEYNNKGMVLLRNKFFKSCCFNCNIQKWFEDNNITSIAQLNGETKANDIKDIKLITTPSSIKYLKFGSFEKWLENIEELFGVVKYEKPPHYFEGELVSIHYQLLNTLGLSKDDVEDLLKESFDFIDQLKENPSVLRYYIQYPIECFDEITPSISKNDIVFKLLGINDKFAKTKIYNDFKNDLIASVIKNIRSGHVLVNGNYSTLCGNPIEMLQQSIGQFTGEQYMLTNTVDCKRFDYGIEVLGTRSPHVCEGNILVTKNKKYELIDKYMNGTNEIVYVNSINDNLLNKLSGAD